MTLRNSARIGGSVQDVVRLQALSDEANNVLFVSDQILYLLANYAQREVQFYSRYAKEFLDGDFYQSVEEDDPEAEFVDDLANRFGVEVIPVTYNPPLMCLMYKAGSAQTVSNNTSTQVTFDTLGVDNGAINDLANSAIVFQRAGFVTAHARVVWQINSTGIRQLVLNLNGNTLEPDRKAPLAGSFNTIHEINAQFEAQEGDTLKLFCYQNSGGNLDIQLPFTADHQVVLSIIQV